jgi:hypothetical protein
MQLCVVACRPVEGVVAVLAITCSVICNGFCS